MTGWPRPPRGLRGRLLVLLLAAGLVPTLTLGALGLRVIAGLSGAATRAATQALDARAQAQLLSAAQAAAQRLGAEYGAVQQQAYVLAMQVQYLDSNPGLFPADQQGNTGFVALPGGAVANRDPTIGVFAPASALGAPGFWPEVSLLSHVDPLLRSMATLRCCLPPVVRYWVLAPDGLLRVNPNPGFAATPPVQLPSQAALLAYFGAQPEAALQDWQWSVWTLPYADGSATLVSAVVPVFDDSGAFRGLAGADASTAALQVSLEAVLTAPFDRALVYRPVGAAGPAPVPYPPGPRPLAADVLAQTPRAPAPAQFGVPSGTAGVRQVGSGASALSVAYAPVGAGGWMLAEAAPLAAVAAQSEAAVVARTTRRTELAGAALLAALAAGLGAALVAASLRAAATVAQPLRRLTEQLRELGAEGGGEPPAAGEDEVSALSREFAALTARLDAATARWRREAEERARAELAVLREKGRLAREVHDTLAQAFVSIVLLAEGGRGRLAQIEQAAREGLRQARQSMAELAPVAAPGAEVPFVETVRQEAAAFASTLRTPAAVRVQAEDWPELPLPVQVALLGVLRSALGNVREHARARRVGVTLRGAPAEVLLEVRDDGAGFDPAAAPAPGRGRGLPGMRQRTAEIGGVLSVESAPGRGTVVRVRVPRPASGAGEGGRCGERSSAS